MRTVRCSMFGSARNNLLRSVDDDN